MAGEFKVRNGLHLDFTPATDPGSGVFLLQAPSGLVTKLGAGAGAFWKTSGTTTILGSTVIDGVSGSRSLSLSNFGDFDVSSIATNGGNNHSSTLYQTPHIGGGILAAGWYHEIIASGSTYFTSIDPLVSTSSGSHQIEIQRSRVGVVDKISINSSGIIFNTTGVQRLRIDTNGSWRLGAGATEGTSGQVITSNGLSVPPTWQTPAAVSGSFWKTAGTTPLLGNAVIDGTSTSSITFSNLTLFSTNKLTWSEGLATAVPILGTGGIFTYDAGFTFSGGVLNVPAVTAATSVTISAIPTGRVLHTTTAGLVTSDANFNYASGILGLGMPIASVTASTKFDIWGDGTTTGNTLRLANSSGTARFLFKDQGTAAITASSFTASTDVMGMSSTWNPSSGTGTFRSINLTPTYNTTGTYAGIAYGIDINPTLTSVTGLTNVSFRSTSGRHLFGRAAVDLPPGGGGQGATVEINGISGLHVLSLYSSSGSILGYMGNGGQNTETITLSSGDYHHQFSGSLSSNAALDRDLVRINHSINTVSAFSGRVAGFSFIPTITSTFGATVIPFHAAGGITSSTGTTNYRGINITPVYNTSGAHSGGIAYGVNYDPTLTGVTGLTNIAWRNTSGQVLINGSTVTATTVIDVRGTSAWTILRLADNTNTAVFTVDNAGAVTLGATTLAGNRTLNILGSGTEAALIFSGRYAGTDQELFRTTYVGGIGRAGFKSITNGGFALDLVTNATNTSGPGLYIYQESTGTPVVGFGSELVFSVKTASGDRDGGIIQNISTNLTALTESFDFVFKSLDNGGPLYQLYEKFRIKSTGVINIAIAPTNDNTETSILVRQSDGDIQTRAASSLVGSLTATYVGYGDGSNVLTGEAAFTYAAATNTLTVGSARLFTPGAVSNLFLGNGAGNTTLSGDSNTGIGSSTGAALTSGTGNTAVGDNALITCASGGGNTAIGEQALMLATNGNNVAVGNATGDDLTTGANNVLVGAGIRSLTSGSKCVIIGYDIDAQSASADGQLSIQNIIFGTGNTAVGTSIGTGSIGIGVATSLGGRLHVKAENNTLALLLEDDAGNDIFAAGESGGARVIGLYGATPTARATTGISAASFVANTSLIANDSATWGGYTNGQVVQALITIGILT